MSTILSTIDIHIMSLLILFVIIITSIFRKETTEKGQKLFIYMTLAAIIAIASEMFSYIATIDTIYLSYIGNIVSYIFTPGIMFIWTLYVYVTVSKKEKTFKIFAIYSSIPIILNTVLVLLNPLLHLSFTIDSDLTFTRGYFYYILVLVSIVYIIISNYIIFKYRFNKTKFQTRNLFLFTLLPIFGATFQTLFFGTFMLFVTITLGILLVYFNVQSHVLNVDYLTNAYNRRSFEKHLQRKIDSRSEENFIAYMIDIDKFKFINDSYGHLVGDEALIQAVIVLKKAFQKDSFIGRYGGDEFIVVSDNIISNEEALVIIQKELDIFNSKSHQYQLSFSVGIAIYKKSSNLTSDDFFKILDKRMYKAKRAKQFNRRTNDK